jgi:4-carboxymuconolactone decarboxylase
MREVINLARIPTPQPEALSAEQQRVYTRIMASRGNLAGPFAVWLHSPEMADRAQALGEFARYHTSLPGEGRLSELAILLVARHFDCQVEWSLHEPIARAKGLDQLIIDAIRNRTAPPPLTPDEAAVYDFVTQLLNDHFVSADVFAAALACFGQQTLVELTTLVGYYTLVAMTLNVFEVALPPASPPRLTNCPTF